MDRVKSAQLNTSLLEVRQRFVDRIKRDREDLLELISGKPLDQVSDCTIAEIGHRAHKTAGLAGVFGYSRLGSTAHELELLILDRQSVRQKNKDSNKLVLMIEDFLSLCDQPA